MNRPTRRNGAALWLGLATLGASALAASARAPEPSSAPSPAEALVVDKIRRASVTWERRPGPERQVVDQVCLVPDLPTFLEAISAWDERHYFPILIDDVELTFKFLRAFRPARIVRYPRKLAKLDSDQIWRAAVAAVGRSWTNEAGPGGVVPPGETVPKRLGPTPPGVVFSAPESPMLAGAVALAAGRFQPLVRWDTLKRSADVLSESDAQALALELEHVIAERFPRYDQLGDDCDFITLAGAWPYRYETKEGAKAFDDLIGRFPTNQSRWAYVGRLGGDLPASVYRAMCSLFLQPRSAVLFNKYSERERPWSIYSMTGAAERLGQLFPVTQHSGPQANLAGWHEVFDLSNRFGLVMINTHGEPTRFHLTDGPGYSADVPPSVPAVVLMIHSFSAANPADPDTLAGRWLANGAYVYYGSMNEPFLEAFRTPRMVASLIAEHLPLSAVLRKAPPEAYGTPWRLLFLGDPLYRIEPDRRIAPRRAQWALVSDWPAYVEFHPPDTEAPDDLRLRWALKRAIFGLQHSTPPQLSVDLPASLLSIQRARLSAQFRPLYDALLGEILLEAKRPIELLARLTQIPVPERSSAVRRSIETIQVARLRKLAANQDFAQAKAFWAEVVRSQPSADHLRVVTERVAGMAATPARLGDWRTQLRSARRGLTNAPGLPIIEDELKRVEEKLGPSTPR